MKYQQTEPTLFSRQILKKIKTWSTCITAMHTHIPIRRDLVALRSISWEASYFRAFLFVFNNCDIYRPQRYKNSTWIRSLSMIFWERKIMHRFDTITSEIYNNCLSTKKWVVHLGDAWLGSLLLSPRLHIWKPNV